MHRGFYLTMRMSSPFPILKIFVTFIQFNDIESVLKTPNFTVEDTWQSMQESEMFLSKR